MFIITKPQNMDSDLLLVLENAALEAVDGSFSDPTGSMHGKRPRRGIKEGRVTFSSDESQSPFSLHNNSNLGYIWTNGP